MTLSNEYLALLTLGLLVSVSLVVTLVFVYVLGVPWSVCFGDRLPRHNPRAGLSGYSPVRPTELQVYEEGHGKDYNRVYSPSAPPISLLDSDIVLYTNPPMACVGTSTLSPGTFPDSTLQCNDVWAAVLFVIHVAVVVFFAIKAVTATNRQLGSTEEAEMPQPPWLVIILGVASIFAMSTLIGWLWLTIVIRNAGTIIQTMLWTHVIGQFLFALVMLFSGSIIVAVLSAVFGALSYCYMNAVQQRIHFASAVLAAACSSLKHHITSIAAVTFGLACLQMVWFIMWVLGAAGVLISLGSVQEYIQSLPSDEDHAAGKPTGHDSSQKHYADDDSLQIDVPGWIIFLLLLSLFWGMQVLSYMVHTTVGGSMALWWFRPQHKGVVASALYRTCTFHFGSICLGALLVAVLHALREMVRMLRSKARRREGRHRRAGGENECAQELLLCVAEMILGCLESIMQYVNKYAFCFVAAYGDDFVSAGKAALDLFVERGMDAIINDSLISNVFAMGTFLISVIFSASGVIFALLWTHPFFGSAVVDALLLGLLGFYMGATVGMLIGSVIDSAVCMLFVCFAKSPEFLKRFDREEYDKLFASWREFHPDSLMTIAPADVVLYDQALPTTDHSAPTSRPYYHFDEGGSTGDSRASWGPPLAVARPVQQYEY